jgi:hypothetical protein
VPLTLDVETPDGEVFAIDDSALTNSLCARLEPSHDIRLLRSDRAMTDCAPVSVFSLQTVRQLEKESGVAVDKRQFRANVYLDLGGSDPFAENNFIGRSLRLGSQVVVALTKLDRRCMMITLDPETAEKSPALLKAIAQKHEGKAGLYGAVLTEGMVRKGDPVELIN